MHKWNAATVVAMLLLKFSTAGTLNILHDCFILLNSAVLHSVLPFSSGRVALGTRNHALLRTFNTFLLLKNLRSNEMSNYLPQSEKSGTPCCDDYLPESLSRIVLKCLSKSNPEISAWDCPLSPRLLHLKETAAQSECCFHARRVLRIQ